MKVKALKPWSNGEISMEQYEVRDLPDALAQNLIDAGIVVNIGGGSGGGGMLVVNSDEDGVLDKTWQEIHDAMLARGAVLQYSAEDVSMIDEVILGKSTYVVSVSGSTYSSSTKSGYPTHD